MTARHFLTIVAIVQGALLAALMVLIVLNRWFRLRRSTRLNPRTSEKQRAEAWHGWQRAVDCSRS